ncbi:hypothetical protein PIB30_029935 [Stylosanthes scabra]|uniref:DUF4283 domain-containing protein n=1 Tax=Stylosanthes scabra TaxID=79078 RepID=A0ABU6V9H3_9FABA|nr:hypothetical protein [Stylosanthes scabra]
MPHPNLLYPAPPNDRPTTMPHPQPRPETRSPDLSPDLSPLAHSTINLLSLSVLLFADWEPLASVVVSCLLLPLATTRLCLLSTRLTIFQVICCFMVLCHFDFATDFYRATGFLPGKQEEDEHAENKEPHLPIVKDWPTPMEVKTLGSYKLVLTFNSIENMEEAVQSAFLLNHFGKVRKWNEDESNRSRKAWLDIYGMPFHEWNEDNFQKVATIWGKIKDSVMIELNQLKTEVFVKEIQSFDPKYKTCAKMITNHLEKELDADFVKNAEKSKSCGPNDVDVLPFEDVAGNCEKSVSTRCIVDDRRRDPTDKPVISKNRSSSGSVTIEVSTYLMKQSLNLFHTRCGRKGLSHKDKSVAKEPKRGDGDTKPNRPISSPISECMKCRFIFIVVTRTTRRVCKMPSSSIKVGKDSVVGDHPKEGPNPFWAFPMPNDVVNLVRIIRGSSKIPEGKFDRKRLCLRKGSTQYDRNSSRAMEGP